MTSLRQQMAWMLTGAERAREAQERTDEHIRALQVRVDQLASDVAELAATADALPREMRAAIDDLANRIGRIHEQMEQSGE